MAETSALWGVIQQWLDLQRFPPNQSKLAEAVGVARSAVSDWKTGKSRPTPAHLRALNALMEPTLGPDTYTLLMLALMSDMGYGIGSLEEMRQRVPRGRFVPASETNTYSVMIGLPTQEEFDLERAVRARGRATSRELARLKAAGLLPQTLEVADVGRWYADHPDPYAGMEDDDERSVNEVSEPGDTSTHLVAAHEEEGSISGEQEESETP